MTDEQKQEAEPTIAFLYPEGNTMPTLEQMKLWNDMVELHEKMLMGVSVSDDSAIPTGIIKKSRFGYHIELFSADKWSKVRGGRWALTKAGALRMVRRWAETQ